MNHNTAALDLRERLSFAPHEQDAALKSLVQATPAQEAMLLSTCNRTELYLVLDEAEADAAEAVLNSAMQWLATDRGLDNRQLIEACYGKRGDEAFAHMVQVAAGLDSLVLGEPQILGQMKSAWSVAQDAGTVGSLMSSLVPQVFSLAKRIRTDTAIGQNPVSVAYAAVSITRHVFSDLSECQALLIGAGETIQLVARHLRERGISRLVIANRTLQRAAELASELQAEAILLADIPDTLASSDIVVASTASQLPILGKGAVERALRARRHRPMVMVDIAVPRDIEVEVAELNDVYLYTVDDLRQIVEDNRKARQSELGKAEEIIAQGLDQWRARLRERDAVDCVKSYRSQAEALRDLELEKALKTLNSGAAPEQVLAQLARALTNKLIHQPSSGMRDAGARGDKRMLEVAQRLLGLDDKDAE